MARGDGGCAMCGRKERYRACPQCFRWVCYRCFNDAIGVCGACLKSAYQEMSLEEEDEEDFY